MTSPPLALLLSAALTLGKNGARKKRCQAFSMFREKEEALLLVPGCHALSRRTKLTRFNSVETQSTYDAANRLLELHHVLLPIKFVWADPSTWLRAVAVLVHEGLR